MSVRTSSQLFSQLFRYNRYNQYRTFSKTRVQILLKMSKPSVLVTRSNVPEHVLDVLKESCRVVTWSSEDAIPRDELLKMIANKTGLFCFLTDKIDKEVLDAAGCNLKVIATMSVGFDHIDLEEVRKRNIRIGYTPGVLTDATADLTMALLLATSRRVIEASSKVYTGEWKTWAPFWMCGPGLSNSTVGIVGYGKIGHAVAQRLLPFKVNKILYHSRTEKQEAKETKAFKVPFDELLEKSDFIIATCALTPETSGLFDEKAFCKMKPNCIFVNTSRGGLVDQDALCEALRCNKILAAGLDVMSPEPLPSDSPLLKLKNCVLLPHIGSAETETRINMACTTARNLLAGLKGEEMIAELK